MTPQWLWLVVQTAVIAVAVGLYTFNPRSRWQLRNIQGPPSSWLLGNLRQLGTSFQWHLQLDKWYQQYGSVYKIFMGRLPIIIITDPDLLKQVFTKSFMKFHDRATPMMANNEGERVFDEGILFAKGRYWTGIRAACEPLFHSEQLQTYVPIANKAVDTMIAKLAGIKPDEPVEINLALAGFTMDTIGSTAYGVDFKAQEDASSAIVRHSFNIFKPPSSSKRSFTLFRTLIFTFPSLAPAFGKLMSRLKLERAMVICDSRGFIKGASNVLLENARKLAQKPSGDSDTVAGSQQQDTWYQGLVDWFSAPARERFEQAKEAGQREYAMQTPRDHSLLHNLMTARRKDTGQLMTNGQICAQSFTFILAGYETTSMALTYALYELSKNPLIQQKVVEEVDKFGRDQAPSFADLAQFPYIDAVLKEAMRLHPPVTPIVALNRETSEDVQLGPYWLPAGTRVWANIYSLQHEDKFFPSAQEFQPERFLGGQEIHPYAYIPFGAGPRKCIGYRFATMEGVLALIRLYQRFTFSLNEAKHDGRLLEQQSLITLMPKGGVWLNVHARQP